MLSTRDIKRKIRTVRSIQQITQAMKTVSSIKLRRAEQRIRAARPYAEQLSLLLGRLAAGELEHPFLVPRPVQAAGLVLITADKGLAGSFNANLVRAAVLRLRELPNPGVITLGRRGTDAMRRLGFRVQGSLSPLGAEPRAAEVAPLADQVGELYLAGVWDQVEVVYAHYYGGTRVAVVTQQLLPVVRPAQVERVGEYIYEPAPEALLALLMPRYLRTQVHTAVLDSLASEHAARVTAMTLATDNAEDLIGQLTVQYNKARQSAITRELLDIVLAAEALA